MKQRKRGRPPYSQVRLMMLYIAVELECHRIAIARGLRPGTRQGLISAACRELAKRADGRALLPSTVPPEQVAATLRDRYYDARPIRRPAIEKEIRKRMAEAERQHAARTS